MDTDGNAKPPEARRHVAIQGYLEGIPLPAVETLRPGAAARLYDQLQADLDQNTFMAAVFIGGNIGLADHCYWIVGGGWGLV